MVSKGRVSVFKYFMLAQILNPLLALFYPQICHVCAGSVEHHGDGICCPECWTKTRVFSGDETVCAKCSRLLSENPPPAAPVFCHACDTDFYDAAKAVGLYENGLRASVLHLKENQFVARRLRNLLIEAFQQSNFENIDLIVPVPLSEKRRIERGFNQAAILAVILTEATKIKLDESSLIRTVHTPMHRAGMDAKGRALSVRKAFAVTRPKLIEGKRILLVDDVFTSGATVSACADILKKNGANEVFVLTLARIF